MTHKGKDECVQGAVCGLFPPLHPSSSFLCECIRCFPSQAANVNLKGVYYFHWTEEETEAPGATQLVPSIWDWFLRELAPVLSHQRGRVGRVRLAWPPLVSQLQGWLQA